VRIGQRTIFNLMGPLSNPAKVASQLIGIARPAYVPIYAGAMARLGTGRSLIVSGDEGLDELSLAGGNEVAAVTGNAFTMERVDASAAGLAHAPIEAIRGDDAVHNAAALKALLMGAPGPYRDAVLFNAAGALLVADRGTGWRDRAAMAAEALDSGRAKALLERWIEMAK
jgi:anthranilate phosphoribosyltransferase